MTLNTQSARNRKQGSMGRVNLVSARSRSNSEVKRLSRVNSAKGYNQLRRKRSRRKKALLATGIALTSLFIVAAVAVTVYAAIINGKLGTTLQGNQTNFTDGAYQGLFVPPEQPEDPFWILLVGTDGRDWETEYSRTDTLILVRIDQANKTAAMVSIPRDLYVDIPGFGKDKINAAYVYGEMEKEGSGMPLTIRTVSAFAGVDIAYFVQVNFDGLVRLVDDLGGVVVDVPVDIIGDHDAGSRDIYQGVQRLDGETALIFCRARESFDISDFQRQANQRTFLQALAKQILAADPSTIAKTVSNMADMTFTNMDISRIIKIAQSMRGMQENAIHTYHVPSDVDMIDGVSVVLAEQYSWYELIHALDSGDYPPPQDDSYAGVVPESYIASITAAEDHLSGQKSSVETGDYVVDVRNGYGIDGSARSVSLMLVDAGYVAGEVGDATAYIYDTTLIIYQDAAKRAAAEDIRKRLGYGRIIASNGVYEFNGDILVVVGGDFKK